MSDGSLPVVSPPADATPREADVRGVLLAAGTSSRFGDRNKLLQPIDGVPLVRRAVEPFLAADLDGVVVVVGHESTAVREALDGLDVDVRPNDAYEEGQSTSVRAGVLAAAERGADAVVVGLGDMPDVSPGTVDALVATYQRDSRTALAAAYDGQRGNPVLFDSRHFDALTSVDGDVGGRRILLETADAALVETGDAGVLRDVDTPDDRIRRNREGEQ